jgi:hypothetical protein
LRSASTSSSESFTRRRPSSDSPVVADETGRRGTAWQGFAGWARQGRRETLARAVAGNCGGLLLCSPRSTALLVVALGAERRLRRPSWSASRHDEHEASVANVAQRSDPLSMSLLGMPCAPAEVAPALLRPASASLGAEFLVRACHLERRAAPFAFRFHRSTPGMFISAF